MDVYHFICADRVRRERIAAIMREFVLGCIGDKPDPDLVEQAAEYLLGWLAGQFVEAQIPVEYEEIKEYYAEIAPRKGEWTFIQGHGSNGLCEDVESLSIINCL